jgi:hypothetical protein
MPDDALDGFDFFVGAGLVAFVRDFDEEEAGAGQGRVASSRWRSSASIERSLLS